MHFLSSPSQAVLPLEEKPKTASKFKRKRLLVDPAFQFRLLLRVVWYALLWTVVAFHFSFVLYAVEVLFQTGLKRSFIDRYLEFFSHEKALLLTVVVVAPLILFDLLKFSNRIAGPLYRCRRVMRDMAAGKIVAEFHPREKDLMKELFEDFNACIREWNARLAAEQSHQAQV